MRALLAFLCLAGCDGEAEPEGIEALEASFSARGYVSMYERLAKQTSEACACSPTLEDYNAQLLLDLSAQGLRFDEDCALAQLRDLEEAGMDCGFVPFAQCKLMHGDKQPGEACEVLVDGIDDCADGLRCLGLAATDGPEDAGTCARVGEQCWADWECEAGACLQGRCTDASTLGDLGEDCAQRACKPEFSCTNDTCVRRDACDLTPNTGWAKKQDVG